MIDIRTVTEDEFEAYCAALETSFGGRLDEEELRRSRTVAEFGRGHAAFDDGRIVGAAEAATFSVTVPGGADVPAAAVTAVGVVPTHRREGIARALMRAQLDDIHGRGESLALLYASEGGIYPRYGYGVATFDAAIEADTDHAAFVPGYVRSGRVRLAERSEALPLMHAVYDRLRAGRPGAVGLSEPWWDLGFSDRPKDDPTFFALHDTDGTVDGFATYRVKHDWTAGVPQSELDVRHLLAVEPGAWADLWRYVLDVDLIKRVVAHAMPVDDPLFHLVQEPRRLHFRIADAMYARLVDVPAALAARGYTGDGRLVIEVLDEFCPWNAGRIALECTEGHATCSTTTEAAELTCSASDLGAIYLGGTTFRQLHRAGRIEENAPGALARADTLFASDPAPWSVFQF